MIKSYKKNPVRKKNVKKHTHKSTNVLNSQKKYYCQCQSKNQYLLIHLRFSWYSKLFVIGTKQKHGTKIGVKYQTIFLKTKNNIKISD